MIIRLRKNQSTKARSKKSEARAAAIMGGKVQPASGAINRFDLKADIKSDTFLVDDKTTNKKSYTLKLALWEKLKREAFMNKRRPCIRVEFGGTNAAIYMIDELTLWQLLNKSL